MFQFPIHELRWWARQAAEVHWPDEVPIYYLGEVLPFRAAKVGDRYIYGLPKDLDERLKKNEGQIIPLFGRLPDRPDGPTPQLELSRLFFSDFMKE